MQFNHHHQYQRDNWKMHIHHFFADFFNKNQKLMLNLLLRSLELCDYWTCLDFNWLRNNLSALPIWFSTVFGEIDRYSDISAIVSPSNRLRRKINPHFGGNAAIASLTASSWWWRPDASVSVSATRTGSSRWSVRSIRCSRLIQFIVREIVALLR